MHASKLLTLLRGLQPEEIHWFQKFLKSPFYNSNVLTFRLFEYIKKYYPELDSPKLTKEKAFQRLFPNEKFKAQKLRKVMFELAVLTEEFFITMHLRKKEFQKKKILVEELGERNLYAQFKKGTKQLMKELESLPCRDTFFYKDIYELNYNYSNHQETNRQKLNGQLLKNATEHLDYFYLLQKQQLKLGIKSHEKLFKEKVKLSTLKQAEIVLQSEPVFKIYELINKAISKSDNDENYFNIESLFKNEIEKLGRNDTIVILKILFNYSISQVNKGRKEYFNRLFLLYKFGLEQGLLIEKKQIAGSIFTNIITTGVNLKEFDWVESFIQEYKKFLPDSVREDASCFGLGLLFFHKKEFSKTIDLILNHTFSKPLLTLQSKTILLRAYFEQYLIDNSYYDLLIAQTQAFEKFIRRNELISEIKKDRYLNFALFTRKIVSAHWQNKLDQSVLEKLNSNEVLLKFWLIEKIKELQK
ncbi:MAG: hypothetical protein AB8F94_12650 [Saprospiraceae bacterium]